MAGRLTHHAFLSSDWKKRIYKNKYFFCFFSGLEEIVSQNRFVAKLMNSSMSIVVFSRVFYWFMTLQTLTHSISFNTGWRQWIRYSMIYLICNMLFCKNKNIIDKLTLHRNFIRLKRSFQVNYLSWVTCFIVKPLVHIYLEQVHCKDCFLLIAPYWESIAPLIFMIVVLDLTMELDFYSGEWGNTQGRYSPSLALLFIFSLWLALLSICMTIV